MQCNIKPVPFHESDKHIFAKNSRGWGGGGGGGVFPVSFPPPPPPGSAHERARELYCHLGSEFKYLMYQSFLI